MHKHLILILFILLCVNFKTVEKFTRNKLVNKCFNKKQLDSFKEYEKNSLILKNEKGVLYLTPIELIDDLPYVPFSSGGMFLNNLCVDPDFRKKGYAIDLINKAIEKTVKLNRNYILCQIKKKNKKSMNLFKNKFNFSVLEDALSEDYESFQYLVKIL